MAPSQKVLEAFNTPIKTQVNQSVFTPGSSDKSQKVLDAFNKAENVQTSAPVGNPAVDTPVNNTYSVLDLENIRTDIENIDKEIADLTNKINSAGRVNSSQVNNQVSGWVAQREDASNRKQAAQAMESSILSALEANGYEDPNFWGRLKNTATGLVSSWGGQMVDAARTLSQSAMANYNERNKLTADFIGDSANIINNEILANSAAEAQAYFADKEVKALRGENKISQALQGTADDLALKGAEDIATAKMGLGNAGKFIVDAGVALGQTGLDIATGGGIKAATKGVLSPMSSFATRAFGGSTMQARQEGANLDEQLAYGTLSAAKEIAVEKLFSVGKIFKNWSGKGVTGDLSEKTIRKVVDKLAKTDKGKTVLTHIANGVAGGAGEFVEEGIAGILEPALQRITYNPDAEWNWEDILYESLVALPVGSFISGVSPVDITPSNNAPQTENQTAQQVQNSPVMNVSTAQNIPATEAANATDEDKIVGSRLSQDYINKTYGNEETFRKAVAATNPNASAEQVQRKMAVEVLNYLVNQREYTNQQDIAERNRLQRLAGYNDLLKEVSDPALVQLQNFVQSAGASQTASAPQNTQKPAPQIPTYEGFEGLNKAPSNNPFAVSTNFAANNPSLVNSNLPTKMNAQQIMNQQEQRVQGEFPNRSLRFGSPQEQLAYELRSESNLGTMTPQQAMLYNELNKPDTKPAEATAPQTQAQERKVPQEQEAPKKQTSYKVNDNYTIIFNGDNTYDIMDDTTGELINDNKELKGEFKTPNDAINEAFKQAGIFVESIDGVSMQDKTPIVKKDLKRKPPVTKEEKIVDNFINAMEAIRKKNGTLYTSDVRAYAAEHPEINFIEKIHQNRKFGKSELNKFLANIHDPQTVIDFGAYFQGSYGSHYKPDYKGDSIVFQNAIKKRADDLRSIETGGRNLKIENNSVSIEYIEDLFNELNSNEELALFSEKVFATAKKLGVHIRFANDIIVPEAQGVSLGDMVEYKTSYFNNHGVSDQAKAHTLLHELLHTCTVYAIKYYENNRYTYKNKTSGTFANVIEAAKQLEEIYENIRYDTDFTGQYGLKNTREMVAELANEEFIALMKRKNIWNRVIDAICSLFGFKRGNSAFNNARQCVEYILDNPNIEEYQKYSSRVRNAAREQGKKTFYSNLADYSIKSTQEDLDNGIMEQDLVRYGIMSEENARELMVNLQKLIDHMIPVRKWVDMNEKESRDNRLYVPFKDNSDPLYKKSLDFSTLCKKRVMTQYVIEALQVRMGKSISAEEQMAIRDRLIELKKQNKELADKIEVACALCYVEAARLKSPKFINQFLSDKGKFVALYIPTQNAEYKAKVEQSANDLIVSMGYESGTALKHLSKAEATKVRNLKKKMWDEYETSAEEKKIIERAASLKNEDFLTSSNLAEMKRNPDTREIYNAFVTYVRQRTHSKELQEHIPYYYGDSRAKGALSDKLIESMNDENGLRTQSWSDFEIIHMLDNIVSIIELSIRKAKMHGYTKVPNFVILNGETGMMINMSLIPEGDSGMHKGELTFSSTEGMAFEVAKELRELYPETAGTIAIGVNNNQIKKLLDSEDIDYVIPYHTSGLNAVLRRMAKIHSWDNFQNDQAEKKKDKNKPSGSKPNFSEWFDLDAILRANPHLDANKDGVKIMQAAAQRYFKLCEERNLTPKFNTKGIVDHPNYWKLLIDRKMVNQKTGGIIIQKPVVPKFNFKKLTEMVDNEVKEAQSKQGQVKSLVEIIEGEYESGEIERRLKTLKSNKKEPKNIEDEVNAKEVDDGYNTDVRVEEASEQIKEPNEEVNKVAEVRPYTEKEKKTTKEKLFDIARQIKRGFDDSGSEITRIAKIVGDDLLYPMFNHAKQAKQMAEYMLSSGQYNMAGEKVGKSLIEILDPIRQKGDDYYVDFQSYLFHMHNIDRMKVNKPVFDKSVTAEMSEAESKRLLKEHPEFLDYANEVWAYSDNLMQYRVDSKLLSFDDAQKMQNMYPHYVPTFREIPKTDDKPYNVKFPITEDKDVITARTVYEATGSNEALLPLHESLARQTMQTVQAAHRNIFGLRLLTDALNNQEKMKKFITKIERREKGEGDTKYDIDLDELRADRDAVSEGLKNTFIIYENGKKVKLRVSPELFEGIKSMTYTPSSFEGLIKASSAYTNTFKKLVTGYNPMFIVTNFVKDLQDASLYTVDFKGFVKNYPKAWKLIAKNDELWQQYQAIGGFGTSYFDYDAGYKENIFRREGLKGNFLKAFDAIEKANFIIEQSARFTEFLNIIDREGSESFETLLKAMYGAADITVNFGRSGTWGKTLNSTLVPYFNPSVQGFSKLIRTFTSDMNTKKFTVLAIRAAALGVTPTLLNALMYSDDDDYELISNRDKDNFYLFKLGNEGLWVKVPKGRVVGLIGNTARRTLETIKGEEDAWAGFFSTNWDNTGIINPVTDNIFAPYLALFVTGKTWYGTDIEPQRLANLPAGERYDEKTDYFSKWLGGVLNFSPKKINYLLDSVTGVVGDFMLPLLTPRAEQNPFAKKFILDSVTSNKIADKFYTTMDDYNLKKNSAKVSQKDAAIYSKMYSYLSKQSSAVSDINRQIREIELSQMSDKEKKAEVRELKAVVNGIQHNAIETLSAYEAALRKNYTNATDDAMAITVVKANKDCFGAEYALMQLSKTAYAKAAKSGLSYNEYLNGYLIVKDISLKDDKVAALKKKGWSQAKLEKFLSTQYGYVFK